MPFIVRLDVKTLATCATEDEALARARDIVRENADKQPEVLDSRTGRGVAPGASARSRDHLAQKTGF